MCGSRSLDPGSTDRDSLDPGVLTTEVAPTKGAGTLVGVVEDASRTFEKLATGVQDKYE